MTTRRKILTVTVTHPGTNAHNCSLTLSKVHTTIYPLGGHWYSAKTTLSASSRKKKSTLRPPGRSTELEMPDTRKWSKTVYDEVVRKHNKYLMSKKHRKKKLCRYKNRQPERADDYVPIYDVEAEGPGAYPETGDSDSQDQTFYFEKPLSEQINRCTKFRCKCK